MSYNIIFAPIKGAINPITTDGTSDSTISFTNTETVISLSAIITVTKPETEIKQTIKLTSSETYNKKWSDFIKNNAKAAGSISTYNYQILSYQLDDSEISPVIVVINNNSYWLASDFGEVYADDNIYSGLTYYTVKRTKESMDVHYMKLSIGNNSISVRANNDNSNYYLYCKDTGIYTFTANSSKAYLGYEESDTTTWVDGTSFSLKANAGEVLYVCCSNQDFSDETYNLIVTYNN